MSYTPITWTDKSTLMEASHMNEMEQALKDHDDQIAEVKDSLTQLNQSLTDIGNSGTLIGGVKIYSISPSSNSTVQITSTGTSNPALLYVSNGNVMQVGRAVIVMLGRRSNTSEYPILGGSSLTITYEQGETTSTNIWTISNQQYSEGFVISTRAASLEISYY